MKSNGLVINGVVAGIFCLPIIGWGEETAGATLAPANDYSNEIFSLFQLASTSEITVFEGFVQGKWDGYNQQFPIRMLLSNFRPRAGAKFQGRIETHWDQGTVSARVWGQIEGGNPRRIKIFEPRHPGNGYYSGTLSTTGMGGSYHYYKKESYPDYQWTVTFSGRH